MKRRVFSNVFVLVLSVIMITSFIPLEVYGNNYQDDSQENIYQEKENTEIIQENTETVTEGAVTEDTAVPEGAIDEEIEDDTENVYLMTASNAAASINSFQVQDRVQKLINNYNGTYFTNVDGTYGKKDPNSNTYHSSYDCSYCNVANVIKTSKIQNEYPNGISTANMPSHYNYYQSAWSKGDSCCGFTSFAGLYIFGNGKNLKVTGKYKGHYSYTSSNISKIKNSLNVGDLIRFNSSHSAVYLGISSKGMKVIDSNYWYYDGGVVRGVCQVRVHNIPFSKYSRFGYTRGTNKVSVPSRTPKSITPVYSGLRISWTSVPGADGYIVYRSTSSKGKYSKLGSTTGTSYTNTSVKSGVTYYYKIKSYNKCNGSTYYSAAGNAKSGKWTASKCTISYNANGGEGAPASQTKVQKTTLVLSKKVPKRTGYKFMGWATTSMATSAQYSAGGKYTTDKEGVSAVTLYAVWKSVNDISIGKVILSPTTFTYDGNKKTPGVKVTLVNDKVLSEISDYIVTNGSATDVGVHTVTVKGLSPYMGTKQSTFTIKPKGTSIYSLRTTASKSLTVKWNKQTTQTDGYRIAISRTSSTVSSGVSYYTVAGSANISKKITTKYGGKRYYVKVQTYKTVNGTKYWSGWSKVKSIIVKK